MPFVQAKCPECGGMLAVDDSKKAANCQFCGEAFIVQEAINNYITNNIINNNTTHNYGEGAVVNVYEDKVKDFVIEAGVLKEYHGASVDVVIPDGVLEIGDNCFKGLKIKSVMIPNSVINIEKGAFENCTNLASVRLPGGKIKINASAFFNTPYYLQEKLGPERKNSALCTYCGSTFKNVFSSTCKICGGDLKITDL